MSASSKAYRAYMITSNNPEQYYSWAASLDYRTASPEDYRAVLEKAIDQFVNGANGKTRDPSKNGAVACFERGEMGTPHIHCVVSSANPIRWSAVQKSYPHSEIEPLKGTAQQALDYIYKRGDHADKQATQLCEPVAWGEVKSDNKPSGKQPIFSEIDELLDQGLSPKEIYQLGAKYSFYRNSIETTYCARKAAEIPQEREITCYYHLGASGTGKSHTLLDLQKKYGEDQVYMVNGLYKNIWDTYNFERCVILDDFRGTAMPLHALCGLLDCYYTLARCRYSDKPLAFNEVHITSVIPPEHLYQYNDEESFQQLKRRITYMVYHYIDPAQANPYCTMTLASCDYKGAGELRKAIGSLLGTGNALWASE